MPFDAHWVIGATPEIPYQGRPALVLEGGAKRYFIDWGDCKGDVVQPFADTDGDGLKEVRSPNHFYEDGTYKVSISQGASDHYVAHWQVVFARSSTTGLDLVGSTGFDYVVAGSGDDVLRGRGSDDILLAGDGADRLIGGSGDDALYGGLGADTLIGGAGDDLLQGDNGVDNLVGGAGSDVFRFARPLNDVGSELIYDPDQDIVHDFEQGIDKLDFHEWRFRRDIIFIGEEEFHGNKGHGEVRFEAGENGDTIVSADFEGDGRADVSVRIIGHFTLESTNFIF